MKTLKQHIQESILSSTGSGKAAAPLDLIADSLADAFIETIREFDRKAFKYVENEMEAAGWSININYQLNEKVIQELYDRISKIKRIGKMGIYTFEPTFEKNYFHHFTLAEVHYNDSLLLTVFVQDSLDNVRIEFDELRGRKVNDEQEYVSGRIEEKLDKAR